MCDSDTVLCFRDFSHSGQYPLVHGVCLDKQQNHKKKLPLGTEYVDYQYGLQTFISDPSHAENS